ncbi:MAG: hypothetical protein GY772_16190, partial [bacterium]|nr:hypothetical protein [bacterium]
MGTSSMTLKVLGWPHVHTASADPKQCAMDFMAGNRLLGEHHFGDVASLRRERKDGRCGPPQCLRHGMACPTTDPRQPDLVVLGFPCQPWSGQRVGRYSKAPPHTHREYNTAQAACEYVLRAKPRLALLENTRGFEGRARGDSAREDTGMMQLCAALLGAYWVSHLTIDLAPWVYVSAAALDPLRAPRLVAGRGPRRRCCRVGPGAPGGQSQDAPAALAAISAPTRQRGVAAGDSAGPLLDALGEEREEMARGSRRAP